MKTIYADSNSQHIKAFVVFGGSNGKLYVDENNANLVSGDDLKEALLTNSVVVNYDGGCYIPSGFSETDADVSVTILPTIEDTITPVSLISGPKRPTFTVVNPDDLIDCFNKRASDLQENMYVTNDNRIVATLKHITDYEGFSPLPEEQEGWYLATHWVPKPAEAEIYVYKTKGTVGWKKLSKPDLTMVSRVTNKYGQKLKAYCEYQGLRSDIIEFDLSSLTLEK